MPETSGDDEKVPYMSRVWHTLCRTLADGAVFQNNERTREKRWPRKQRGGRVAEDGDLASIDLDLPFRVRRSRVPGCTGFHPLLRRFSWALKSHSARERPV
jgi:hypothetical protein